MDDDALLARWPRPVQDVRVARETRVRDAATAAALQAYLTAGSEPPVRTSVRL